MAGAGKPLAVFRVDGSTALGGGHVLRCLTLANALAEAGWVCAFAVNGEADRTAPALAASPHQRHVIDDRNMKSLWPGGCRLFVVDHHDLDARFEAGCRPWARSILAIDDLANRYHDADFLLDQTLGRAGRDYAGLTPDHTELMLGAEFALLQPQFADSRARSLKRRRAATALRRVMISFGATDVRNFTPTALEALSMTGLSLDIEVVLGAGSRNQDQVRRLADDGVSPFTLLINVEDIAAVMARADLAIGAGGSSSFERCALGLPSLMVTMADNQDEQAAALNDRGAAHLCGRHDEIDAPGLAQAVCRIANDWTLMSAMSDAAAGVCDGGGAARVLRSLRAHLPASDAA